MAHSLLYRFRRLVQHPAYKQNSGRLLWRAGAWSLHCLLHIPAKAKFRRWNFRLHLPPVWRGGGSTGPYILREEYEPELKLLETYLRPGMVFVDGGANTGVFTFTAARLVGAGGQVLAFEPGAACFRALQCSLRLNKFDHVSLHQQALSDRSGIARLYHHNQQQNAYSLGADEGVPFDEVSTSTLDEVASAMGLLRVDFIKLDVEGAEELVLRGAEQVLDKWRPIVLFEINTGATALLKLSVDGACRVLEERGYELFRMDEEGKLTAKFELPELVGNVVALPKKQLERIENSEPESGNAIHEDEFIEAESQQVG